MKKANKIEEIVIKELAKRRKALGYSYEKLAELSGLHRTSISLIERNKIHPTFLVCLKIAEALELDLSEIMKIG